MISTVYWNEMFSLELCTFGCQYKMLSHSLYRFLNMVGSTNSPTMDNHRSRIHSTSVKEWPLWEEASFFGQIRIGFRTCVFRSKIQNGYFLEWMVLISLLMKSTLSYSANQLYCFKFKVTLTEAGSCHLLFIRNKITWIKEFLLDFLNMYYIHLTRNI